MGMNSGAYKVEILEDLLWTQIVMMGTGKQFWHECVPQQKQGESKYK